MPVRGEGPSPGTRQHFIVVQPLARDTHGSLPVAGRLNTGQQTGASMRAHCRVNTSPSTTMRQAPFSWCGGFDTAKVVDSGPSPASKLSPTNSLIGALSDVVVLPRTFRYSTRPSGVISRKNDSFCHRPM